MRVTITYPLAAFEQKMILMRIDGNTIGKRQDLRRNGRERASFDACVVDCEIYFLR